MVTVTVTIKTGRCHGYLMPAGQGVGHTNICDRPLRIFSYYVYKIENFSSLTYKKATYFLTFILTYNMDIKGNILESFSFL